MLNREDVKAGTLVWWSHSTESWGGEWNCPGVITEVDEVPDEGGQRYCTILTFDNFATTKILILDPEDRLSRLHELSPTTVKKVGRYFTDTQREYADIIVKKQRELEDAQDALQDWESDMQAVYSKYLKA